MFKNDTFQASPGLLILRQMIPARSFWVCGIGDLFGRSSQGTSNSSKVFHRCQNCGKMNPGDPNKALNLPQLVTTYWESGKMRAFRLVYYGSGRLCLYAVYESMKQTWSHDVLPGGGPSSKEYGNIYTYIYILYWCICNTHTAPSNKNLSHTR